MKQNIKKSIVVAALWGAAIAMAETTPCLYKGTGECESATHDVVIENTTMRLTLGTNAWVKSLILKKTGEELADAAAHVPFFTVTQDRPFNNEIKLAYPNQRTTYVANRVRREGDRIVVGFYLAPYGANIALKITPNYIAFELEGFRIGPESYPIAPTLKRQLDMDVPPVVAFRLAQIPLKKRANFGSWMNAVWDEKAAVALMATTPRAEMAADRREDCTVLTADLMRETRLFGTAAALIVDAGSEALLDRIAAFEKDYNLPQGVANRRNSLCNASIFSASTVSPDTIDEMIAYAKKGGFRMMLISGARIFTNWSDYRYNKTFPNGKKDLEAMLAKVRAAGITPGLHVLHSWLSGSSSYVRGDADRRIGLKDHFTLAAPLTAEATELLVDEDTCVAPTYTPCRVLKFGGELMTYESFTKEPPYRFMGLKRGYKQTRPRSHGEGEIGGIVDVSEFGGNDFYMKQDCALQDTIGESIASFWDAGFGFLYFDGSEGVQKPFGFNVANAQYRVWRKLSPQPILGEGAAKTHFGWHMLSGANAFDVFAPEEFKWSIRTYPAAEAPLMRQDLTRVDFGWWGFWEPGAKIRGKTTVVGTQPDMLEYGTSKAAAWDSPASVQFNLQTLKKHPRTADCLETMRRWEDARARKLLSAAQKVALKDLSKEYHLEPNGKGGYDLLEWEQLKVANEGEAGVRAFLFEQNGKRVVIYWHAAGKGKLTLPGGLGVLEAAAMKRWETALSKEDVKKTFSEAHCE